MLTGPLSGNGLPQSCASVTLMATPEGQHVFRPRARVLRLLGEELISDETIAVVELVRNAWDADALSVKVAFHNAQNALGGSLDIIDDGHGMSKETVLGSWLQPATPDKKLRQASPSGRPLLGKKGVGRFAADKLARKLVLITKKEGETTATRAVVDWNQFDDPMKFLDEIHPQIDSHPTPAIGHGTSLFLQDLRSSWSEDRIAHLKLELLKLFPPFRSTEVLGRPVIPPALATFQVKLEVDGISEDIGQFPQSLRTLCPWRVRAAVRAHSPTEDEIAIIINDESERVRPLGGGAKGKKSAAGHFAVEIDVWVRSAEGLAGIRETLDLSLQEARGLLDKWSGISVYRDGFRVFPYGESGNDWLDLDKERINTPKERLSNSQIIGCIYLSEQDNPELRDQTNRQGLVNNDAFNDLRSAIRQVIREIENRILVDKPTTKQRRSGRRLFELESLKRLREIAETSKSVASTQVLAMIGAAEAEKSSAEETISQEISRYRRILSLSVVATRMAHEIRQQVDIIRRAIDNGLKRLAKASVTIVGVSEALARADESAGIVAREVRRLLPFTRARRRIEKIDLSRLAIDIQSDFIEPASKRNIEIKFASPSSPAEVEVDYGELYQAVRNLVDNALFWSPEGGQVTLSVFAKHGSAFITVTDQGPGVPTEDEGVIFEPYWTTKPNGSGLGLPIAGEIAADYGGSLSLKKSSTIAGASFEIAIPRAK